MRIHLYLKHFPSDARMIRSGMEKAVAGLAAGLVRTGEDVTVLCEGPEESVRQAADGYTVRCFAHAGGDLRLAPRLKEFFNVAAPADLVILNAVFHPSCYLLSRRLRRAGIPYVVAPHDPYHPTIFSRHPFKKWAYWHLFERRMLRQAAGVQVLDMRHAAYLKDLGVDRPVVEVINGVALDEVPEEGKLKWRDDGPPRLMFLGRLDEHNKGLDILVDAFAIVVRRVDATLLMQGPDGGDRKAIQNRIERLNLTGRISILETDFTRRSTEISADCDIFCLPSRFEGFGLSALEAMLAGRPVLVSDIAGIAPHVEASGCGLVVNANPSSVAQGMLDLISRRAQWREMGLRGREYALDHLRWDRIAGMAARGYRELLRDSRVTQSAPSGAPAPVKAAP